MSRLLELRHALVAAVLPITLSLAACGGSAGKASQANPTHSSAAQQQSQHATRAGGASGASSRNAQGRPSQTGGTAADGGFGGQAGQHGASPRTGANRSAARNGAASQPPQSSASSARRRAALQHVISVYSACLRQHGVKLPASSNGSLNTKGVNTSSPQYRHASVACRAVAVTALRAAAKQLRSTQR